MKNILKNKNLKFKNITPLQSSFKTSRNMKLYFDQKRFVANTIINFVPEQQAYVIERMGRFHKVCKPGLNILIPFLDNIAYVQSLKIETIEISEQSGITKDNVKINVDGVIFYRVEDPKMASYAVDDHRSGIKQLAMSTMRVEIGKLTLEETFQQRNIINSNIVEAINGLTRDWGVRCLRYEMRDLIPPEKIQNAMELQASAERRKRQSIIESEGERQVEVNIAEGKRRAILLQAKATAESIQIIAKSLRAPGGENAIALRLAEQYLENFSKLAKKSTTMILPSDTSDISKMVAQSFSIWQNLNKNKTEVDENFEDNTFSDDESHKEESAQQTTTENNSLFPPIPTEALQQQQQFQQQQFQQQQQQNFYTPIQEQRDDNYNYEYENQDRNRDDQEPKTFYDIGQRNDKRY